MHNLKTRGRARFPAGKLSVVTGTVRLGQDVASRSTRCSRRGSEGSWSACRPTHASSSGAWSDRRSTRSTGLALRPSPSTRRRPAATRARPVATTTEIQDYLRLLYARLGTPHCPTCGKVAGGLPTRLGSGSRCGSRHPDAKGRILAPLFVKSGLDHDRRCSKKPAQLESACAAS